MLSSTTPAAATRSSASALIACENCTTMQRVFSSRRQLSHPVTTGQSLAEQPGTLIGPYLLLQQIGEGGFGVVFWRSRSGRLGVAGR